MERVLVDSGVSVAESASAALVSGLIKSATSCGLRLDELLTELGLCTSLLADPLGRVPYARLIELLNNMSRLSHYRRELGIDLGHRLMPGSFSALGYAAASCRTLDEAIGVIPCYENVALTAGKTELVITGNWAQLYWSTTHCTYSYLLEEIILSAWVKLAGSITAVNTFPLKVMLTGPTPENTAPFTALFGKDIVFCQSQACIWFPVSLLKTPIIHSDPFINDLMREQAIHIHQALDTAAPLNLCVTEMIRDRLAEGDFGQEVIAAELCLSVRTLRRKLKGEGTRYQTLLDSTRRDLAREYLREHTLSIYEVAMQLGYSEHSAFSAAFKRWFGLSPQDYRAQHFGMDFHRQSSPN